MGKSQRTKGASFEREIANALGVKRKIGQARDGGNDLDLPPYTIECKRRARASFSWDWMEQAIAASTPERPVPVVIVRGDRGEAFVVMRFSDWQGLAIPPAAAPASGDSSASTSPAAPSSGASGS
jgi:hypothetical protein